MEFFDKLGANLTNAGRTVSMSARNFSDTNSLKREINNEKRSIQQKYAEIGQLYYEKFNNDPGCDFFEQVDSILTSMRHIESLEEEIQEVQNRRPELVPIPEGNKTVEPRVHPTAMVCLQCGQTYETTQIFCANCGQKLTPQYPTGAAAALAPEQTAADVQSVPVSEASNTDTETVDAAPAAQADAPAENAAPAEPVKDAPAAPVDPNAPRFCTNCGAKAPAASVFCAQCGNKLV